MSISSKEDTSLSPVSTENSETQPGIAVKPFQGDGNDTDKNDTDVRQPHEQRPRSTSMVSSLRERLSRSNTECYDNYSEKNIYENLNEEEINLRRTQSKRAILDTLVERIAQEQAILDANDGDDLEKATLQRTKSYYEGIGRDDDNLPTGNDGVEFQGVDPELVTWEGDDDPNNPRNWSLKRKWRSVLVVTLYTLLSPFASTMLSPAVSYISADFHNENSTISSLMVSIYILSWAIFPPIVAPLSEMYGRKVVLNVSVWILFAFNLGCALAQNTTQMCVFRLLAGAGGCAPICIGAGVLGDVFNNKDISLAMSLYSLGPTTGPTVSALIAGFIVQYSSWRWCFWVLCILNGVVAVYGNIFLEETYVPVILAKKAEKLRKVTGNENLHSLYEIANGESTFDKFQINITRPIVLLFTHPMVFGLGTFMAIAYGCLYILIVCFPRVFHEVYEFDSHQVGLMYLSFLIGYLIGTFATQRIADHIYKTLKRRNQGVDKPEFRLPLLLQSGVLISVGLFWFGWGAEKHMHFVFTAFGAGIFGYGLIAVFYTIQNYLVQMNPRFAASSIAAASIFRSFLGFAFPLFANQMFNKLGYGWACSIFGFIAIATGIPFPLFVVLYGERLRLWANRQQEKKLAIRDAKNLAKMKAKEAQKAD